MSTTNMSKILIDEATVRLVLEALEAGEYYIDDLKAIVYAADDLGTHEDRAKMQAAITALREALTSVPDWASAAIEQPAPVAKPHEQGPVAKPFAWANTDDLCADTAFRWCEIGDHKTPVYTTAQPAQRTWVAVSDRIPLESDGEVLVRMRDGRCEIAWATYWHGASNAFAQWTFRDPDEGEAPTHWMHIPAIEAAHNIKENT